MNKSILISIKPKYVAEILNHRKTIEIRKTAPKCDLPIEVYIYCTKGDKKLVYHRYKGHGEYLAKNKTLGYEYNGYVVAKFTLKKISEYRCSVYIPEKGIVLPHKVKLQSESNYPSNIANRQNWGWEKPKLKEILNASCLSEKELALYLTDESSVFNGFYAWHIDDLVIFDKPKELSEFKRIIMVNENEGYKSIFNKAPRSWCYVEARK